MRVGIRITNDLLCGVSVVSGNICARVTEEAVSGRDFSAALERALSTLLAEPRTSSLSITFDVSELLTPTSTEQVIALRIAPRPPCDDVHAYSGKITARYCDTVEHIAGGYTKEGEEIVPLDVSGIRAIALRQAPGRRYVVSGVGAAANPAHELEASRLLFTDALPASVNHSHSFHNSSFAVRERTAVINSALLSAGERIVTELAGVVSKHASHARLQVMTNDGGAAPLSALAVKPVHSMLSTGAAELLGAAVISGVDDGWIIIQGEGEAVLGEMTGGTPTVTSRPHPGTTELIATRVAQTLPNRPGLLGAWMGEPTLVHTQFPGEQQTPGNAVSVPSGVDLPALGAACAPIVEWLEREVKIRSEAEKDQVLAASEAKVRLRLASYGVPPSQVRVLEARIIGASYENSNTVSVRVRGIGGRLPSEMLVQGVK